MSGDTNIHVPVVVDKKDMLSSLQETVSTNWQKHRVAILAGTALVAGGLAIALTGGLAAIPGLVAIGLIASGVFGGTGGLAFAVYYASRPIPAAEDITAEATQIDSPVGNDDTVGDEEPPKSPFYVATTPQHPELLIPYDDEKQEQPVASPKAPDGSLVKELMPDFVQLRESPKRETPSPILDSPKPKAPTATIVAVEEEEENTPKDAGAESLNTETTVAIYTPSPLRTPAQEQAPLPEPASRIQVIYQNGHIQPKPVINDKASEEESSIQDAIPSPSAYLPSARSVVKAAAYLTGAVATATTVYVGYHVAQELMKGECPAFDAAPRSLGQHAAQRLIEIGGNVATSITDALAADEAADQGECSIFDHTHRSYAEYYSGKLMGAGKLLQQGASSVASSLNPFSTPDNISLLPLGTDTTNRTIASDSEPGLIDAASSLLAQARESTLAANLQDCAESVKDYFNPGMNVTASDVLECCPLTSGIALPRVPLPSPKLALAGGAALLATGLALHEPDLSITEEAEVQNDEIEDEMKLIPDEEEVTKTEEKKTSAGSQTARTSKLIGLAFAGTAVALGAYRWSQMSPEERELYQNQATTFAASIWNGLASLPDAAEKSFANWVNDTTWGNTAERLTQWMSNADPVGSGSQIAGNLATQVSESSVGQTVAEWISDAGTCVSAATKYMYSGEVGSGQIQTLSEALEACPFVDLPKVVDPIPAATQQTSFNFNPNDDVFAVFEG